MKTLFTFLISVCSFFAIAQSHAEKQIPNAGSSEKVGEFNVRKNIQLSIGAGIISPGLTLKNTNHLGNLTNYNINAYIPVWAYGGATGGLISFGFNVGAEYFSGNKDYKDYAFMAYNITGQSNPPDVSDRGSGSPKQAGFKTEGGLKASFDLGKITISPIINAAYINIKQKAFSILQSSSINGQNRDFELYNQAETKTTGVGVIPKIQFKYRFGRDDRFTIYTEANYLLGPAIETSSISFKPNGAANAQGFYNIDQMLSGTKVIQTMNTKFNGFGVNLGLGISLGRIGRIVNSGKATLKDMSPPRSDAAKTVNPLYDDKENTSANPLAERRVEVLKSNKPGNPYAKETKPKVKCACGKEIYAKDEAACKRICNFLKNGTYINSVTAFTPKELEEIKYDYLNSLFIEEGGRKILNPKLFKLVNNSGHIKGQKVSITKAEKAYAFLGNQDELVKIISIPSARAAECTDCTTRTCNGTTYDCCCVNGFCMCVICIEITTLSPLPEDNVTAPVGNNPSLPAHALVPHHGPNRWWKHNNIATNSCTGSGVFCFNRKFMDAAALRSFIPEFDEVLSETTISLTGDVILIKSIGIRGMLSANTLKAFKENKVEKTGNFIPVETLQTLFNDINLKAPKSGIAIKATEQSYSVNDTQYDGRKVSIVESIDKTSIRIGRKVYQVVIIATSGKGSGSPKQAGF